MPTKYKRSDIKFVNPYTFIPTPKGQQVNRSGLESAQAASLHTGFLQCRLYVRTPLGIPDAENVEEVKIIKESKEKKEEPDKVHKKYPFFSYEKNEKGKPIPAIPGSSLRGPIRSVFEAATDSCFSTLREDTGLSKRMDSYGAYKPGILKWVNGEWKLYRAKRYLLAVTTYPVSRRSGDVDENYRKYAGLPKDAYVNIFQKDKDASRAARTQTGEELYFGDMVEFDAYTEGRGKYVKEIRGRAYVVWEGAARNIRKAKDSKAAGEKLSGLVYIGETFNQRKHGESIFVFGGEERGLNEEELKKAYKDLLKTLEIYRDTGVNKTKSHNGYRGFENAKKENGIPVWYSVEDAKLSMAAIGRTFYKTTLNDLVGDRKPCASRKKLCEACALFGMAGEESLGSRIRFTDAKVEGRYDLQYATLQILGQPRHSYLPFYARKNGAVAESYDDEEVEIAGRKFYWHNEKAATDSRVYAAREKTHMNSTLELVMPRAEFVFKVYYDGITEDQLEKLMWCLNFGENRKDGDLCHKLGHGKPLGLGSVKIIIEEKAERVFADGAYEWKHEKPAESQADPNLRNLEEIKKVMDFRWLSKGPDKNLKIMYPDVYDEHGGELPAKRRNDEARHVWYMENRKKPCPANNFDRIEVLPDILAENQTLQAYQKEVGEPHENGGERGNNDFRQDRGGHRNHRGNNNSKNSHKDNKKREGKR